MQRGAVAVGIVAVVALVIAVAWRAGRPRPNVVIVLWDTVRADRMSLYGHERPTTPHLDAMARDAVIYDAAMSPGMWTVPSHGSLFTGLSTTSHGARVGWLWLDGVHVTMAEHFGSSGYATYAWSSNPYLSEQTNLLQGFETQQFAWRGDIAKATAKATADKLLPDDRSVEIAPGWAPAGHGNGWPEHLTSYKDSAPVAVEQFLSWIDLPQRRGRPFFAYLNLLEAHHPRVPSAQARRAVADEATIARALQTDASLFRIMSAMEGQGTFTADELEALRATYDATLWDLDAATHRLVTGLSRRGMLDNTVFVVTSDHGENLGEHGMFDHRWDLHQTLVHVPLVVRYPKGLAPLPQGPGRVQAPVSTAHLFGTLLELCGLGKPDVAHELPPLGADDHVYSELEAPTPRLAEVRAAWPGLRRDRWAARYQAVFNGAWKYQRGSDGTKALYDLATDPMETTDRSAAVPEQAKSLAKNVAAWDKARSRPDPRLRTPQDKPGNPIEVDADLAAQLKQLGYADDEEEEAP